MTKGYISHILEKVAGDSEILNFSVDEVENGAKISFEIEDLRKAYGFDIGDGVRVFVDGEWRTAVTESFQMGDGGYLVRYVLPNGGVKTVKAEKGEVRAICLDDLT